MGMHARIPMILGAYVGASLAAGSLFLVVFVFGGAPVGLFTPLAFKGMAAAIVVLGGFAAVFGLLPAMPAIIYAERTGVRSFWFYGYGGALTGIIAYGLYVGVLAWGAGSGAWSVLAETLNADRAQAWIIMAAAGFLAGLVYWLIAGRNAGLWRPPHGVIE